MRHERPVAELDERLGQVVAEPAAVAVSATPSASM